MDIQILLTAGLMLPDFDQPWFRAMVRPPDDPAVTLQDVTLPQVIVLSDIDPKHAHSLTVHCSGSIHGEATFSMADQKPKTVAGMFDVRFESDWPSDKVTLQYIPNGVTKGSVTVQFRFHPI